MKHSSHQIRGKCTYYFALEPGITAWQSPVATPVGGSAAAASLGPRLGRGGDTAIGETLAIRFSAGRC